MSDRAIIGGDWSVSLLWEYEIAEHLHGGLERYLKDGIRPGGFLLAILMNDLCGAVNRMASFAAMDSIARIVRFLQNEASDSVWGSPEKVEAWIANEERRAVAARRRSGRPGVRPRDRSGGALCDEHIRPDQRVI